MDEETKGAIRTILLEMNGGDHSSFTIDDSGTITVVRPIVSRRSQDFSKVQENILKNHIKLTFPKISEVKIQETVLPDNIQALRATFVLPTREIGTGIGLDVRINPKPVKPPPTTPGPSTSSSLQQREVAHA